MAQVDDRVKSRSRNAIQVLESVAPVHVAYLFGSHVDGRADKWSDIDIAAFVEGAEDWDIPRRARAMQLVRRQVGSDIEIHFFPASSAENPQAGSFASYILTHGLRLDE